MAVSISDILNILGKLTNLAEQHKISKFNQPLMELHQQIMELQRDYIRITDENETLKKAQDLSDKVSFKRPYVYLEGDPEPYCQKCFDSKKKLIHVGRREEWGLGGTLGRICPECDYLHDESADK